MGRTAKARLSPGLLRLRVGTSGELSRKKRSGAISGISRRCAHKTLTKGPKPVRKAIWHRTQGETRIRGRRLQLLRKRLFDKNPLCVVCQQQGKVRVATIRDHIIPLAEGGQDIESNTQGLCVQCSDTKTRAESLRGVGRTSLNGQW
jgi:5-methylcytosine-specific restriction protein A